MNRIERRLFSISMQKKQRYSETHGTPCLEGSLDHASIYSLFFRHHLILHIFPLTTSANFTRIFCLVFLLRLCNIFRVIFIIIWLLSEQIIHLYLRNWGWVGCRNRPAIDRGHWSHIHAYIYATKIVINFNLISNCAII